jgi:hypothetical protein
MLAGCVSHGPVTPPPAIDPSRLARARDRQPALTAEVELLEWRAREVARRGDLAKAERFARLARELLLTLEHLPAGCTERAPSTDTSTVSEGIEAPRSKKRRRRRRRRSKAREAASSTLPEEAEAPPAIEERMQALAVELRRFGQVPLDAGGRVRVDAAQRALIEAQRALAAGAVERAKQHLDRVTQVLAALGAAPPPGAEPPLAAERDPLSALAKDLEGGGIEAAKGGGWLAVALPEARTPGTVNRSQRERLQVLGRLLRVYGGARACVRASAELPPEAAEPAVEALLRYLRDVEQIDASRFLPCPERGPAAEALEAAAASGPGRLLVGLAFG